MRIGLSQIQRFRPENTLLGDIVSETYDFLRSGASANHAMVDHIRDGEEVQAREYFSRISRTGFQVKQRFLPGDLDVRGIAAFSGKGNVVLETTAIDFDSYEQGLNGILVRNNPKGKSFLDPDSKETVITTKTQNVGQTANYREKDMRTILSLPHWNSDYVDTAVDAINILSTGHFIPLHEAYTMPGAVGTYVAVEAGLRSEMKMEMKMELRQVLEVIQKPMMRTQLRVSPRMRQAQRVNSMTNQEVNNYIRDEMSKNPLLRRDD